MISFLVSIDSMSVGIALKINQESILLASSIFMITSSFFTNFGLTLGKKINEKYQKQSTIIGITILVLIAIKYLLCG